MSTKSPNEVYQRNLAEEKERVRAFNAKVSGLVLRKEWQPTVNELRDWVSAASGALYDETAGGPHGWRCECERCNLLQIVRSLCTRLYQLPDHALEMVCDLMSKHGGM